jgi:hypothetical protein
VLVVNRSGGAVSAGLRECQVRSAGQAPAVVFHPVRDELLLLSVSISTTQPAQMLTGKGTSLCRQRSHDCHCP